MLIRQKRDSSWFNVNMHIQSVGTPSLWTWHGNARLVVMMRMQLQKSILVYSRLVIQILSLLVVYYFIYPEYYIFGGMTRFNGCVSLNPMAHSTPVSSHGSQNSQIHAKTIYIEWILLQNTLFHPIQVIEKLNWSIVWHILYYNFLFGFLGDIAFLNWPFIQKYNYYYN